MAWLYQGVLNAGLQILLSIFGGWLCAYLKLVDPEVLSRQLNAFAMRAAFPAFIIHLLGIKTDLQDLQAWRALGVFILWVFLIHLSCLIWHKLQRGKATVSHLGLNCLLLSTNNTGCIGWPVLIATVGRQGAALSMLLGVLFFIQLLPVTIACFEYQKWLDTHDQDGCEVPVPLTAASADGKLPTITDSTDQAAAGFPHQYRYCYWSMAEYHPQKPRSTSSSNAATAVAKPAYPASAAYPQYVEVHVDHDEAAAAEVAEHRCFGNGGNATTSTTSSSPGSQGSSSIRRNTRDSSGKEWWQTGPPKWVYDQQKQQPGKLQPLKRAKDSCDSLCSPFAAAALNSKEVDMQGKPQVVQSPRPAVSSITRRLSRTLNMTAAAASAAAAVVAPASFVRAASGKKSQQQKGGVCAMTAPLMSSHEGMSSCQAGSSAALPAAYSSCSSSSSTAGSQHSSDTGNEAAGVTAAGTPCNTMKRSTTLRTNTAADSAVELHHMGGGSSSEQELFRQEQQLRQQLAAGGSDSASGNSFLNSAPLSNRVHNRTGLLAPTSGKSAGTILESSKSKLGSAAGAGAGAAGEVMRGEQAVAGPRSPFVTFVKNHPLLVHITVVQLKSFHLWLNLVAIALSVSGARKYLDPESPQAIPALGFLDGVLAWFSSACIPVLLFANGVWMCGKDVFGGKKGQMQVTLLLLMKLTVLPAVMVGLTLMCGMRDQYGLSLVLLTACPLAPLAFLVCQQYGSGAELATSVTIQGVLLMLPQMMALIKIAQVTGLYEVELLKAA